MTPPPGTRAREARLRPLIASDLRRFEDTYRARGQKFSGGRVFWESVLFKAGFQAVLLYRVSHWLFSRGWIYPAWWLTRLNVALTGAEIEFNAQIGPGLFIAHPVGIVIGRGTVIGARATIFQGVTFGAKGWHPEAIGQFPMVGHDCFFFTHAVVIGGITIGNSCVVGAQAVVMHDMPDGSLAAGVPARIYPDRGRETIESWGALDRVDPTWT